jgi:PAS domain S-box-containing protein
MIAELGESACGPTESWFRRIVEAAPNAMVVVDRDRVITLVNRGAELLFGYDRAELVGHAVELLLPARFRVAHPEHVRIFVNDPTIRAMGAGRELFGCRKDGSEVAIEIGLNPLVMPEGLFILASIIDITERKRTQERFRLIVEAVPNAVVIVDRGQRITLINRAADRLFGYPRDELIGQPIEILVPERFRDRHAGYVELFLARPDARAMGAGRELFGRRKDASEVPIEIGLNPLDTPEGLLTLVSITDVSERRAAEQLRLDMAALADTTEDAIVTKNLDGIVGSFNARAEQLLGYRAEEIIGKPITLLVPEDRMTEELSIMEQISRGQRVSHLETIRQRKDGSKLDVSLTISPIRDRRRTVIGAAKVMRDITEHKRTQETFRLVVEAAPNAILVVDQRHTITLVNHRAEELFGYTRAELVSQPIELLVPRQFHRAHAAHVEGFFADPRTRAMGVGRELLGRHKDGTEISVEIGLNPFQTAAGRFTLASIIDITERKAKDDELRRSNAELEQFAYIASHDLQEPLRMVASYTELLGQRYRGKLDDKADKYIFYAVDGAKRMQQLVADLLAYSRVGSQGRPLMAVDAEAVVHSVVDMMRATIRKAQATVEISALPAVLADEGQLRQLFQNLIGNALKFRAEADPVIGVRAARHGDRWLFCVEDNGIGIDMQYAERIFQMFQRLHERGKYEGSGIGLSIVKRIVERHGGTIWLESKPGLGTSFFFSLLPAGAKLPT